MRSDLDQWSWENVPRSPGLRAARIDVPLLCDSPVRAHALLGPQGISGRVKLPAGLVVQDAVLMAPGGRLGTQIAADGQFSAGVQDVLGSDQYFAADLLSDEQVRRSRILAAMSEQTWSDGTDAPVLCCWTDPWPAGIDGDADARQTGAALVLVPLELARPAAGTPVRLPAPLLSFRETIGPDGLHPSGLYDYRRRQWTQKLWTSSTWLRFQIPGVLPPFELTAARIRLQVSGPMGQLKLSTERDGQVTAIKSWTDPIGTLDVEIPAAQLPQVTADGGMLLRIDAGDPDREGRDFSQLPESGQSGYWQIEWMQMELEGIVGEAIEPPADSQQTAQVPP
jgi:hypothetical protein